MNKKELEKEVQDLKQQIEKLKAEKIEICSECRGTGIMDFGYGETYYCGCNNGFRRK